MNNREGNPVAQPTVADLQRFARTGRVKKVIARYFIPRDHEGSIRRHERFGTKLVQKAMQNTRGRIRIGGKRMDRLDPDKNRIDAAADYAFTYSVGSEIVHTTAATTATLATVHNIVEGNYP